MKNCFTQLTPTHPYTKDEYLCKIRVPLARLPRDAAHALELVYR